MAVSSYVYDKVDLLLSAKDSTRDGITEECLSYSISTSLKIQTLAQTEDSITVL